MADLELSLLRVGTVTGAVAVCVLLAFSWPWRAPRPVRMALGWVLWVAAAFYLGSYLLESDLPWPPFELNERVLVIYLPAAVPPLEVRDRLLIILLPGTVLVECMAAFRWMRWWIAWTLRLVIAASAARVLLHD